MVNDVSKIDVVESTNDAGLARVSPYTRYLAKSPSLLLAQVRVACWLPVLAESSPGAEGATPLYTTEYSLAAVLPFAALSKTAFVEMVGVMIPSAAAATLKVYDESDTWVNPP